MRNLTTNPVPGRSVWTWTQAGLLALILNGLGEMLGDLVYPAFAWPAAQFAGMFFNSSAAFDINGRLFIPLATTSIHVTPECSGYGFFCLMTALFAVGFRNIPLRIPVIARAGLICGLAYFITISTNACRIICGYQCHRIFLYEAPAAVANLAHLFIGVTIFLTVLILVYLVLERKANHDRLRAQTAPA